MEHNFYARKAVTLALFAIRGTSYNPNPWNALFDVLCDEQATADEIIEQAEAAYIDAETIAVDPERSEQDDQAFPHLLDAYNEALDAAWVARRKRDKEARLEELQ